MTVVLCLKPYLWNIIKANLLNIAKPKKHICLCFFYPFSYNCHSSMSFGVHLACKALILSATVSDVASLVYMSYVTLQISLHCIHNTKLNKFQLIGH